jgi:hypothetical protein
MTFGHSEGDKRNFVSYSLEGSRSEKGALLGDPVPTWLIQYIALTASRNQMLVT